MKFKLKSIVLGIVCMMLLFGTANAATVLTRLGLSPFHQPPFASVDEFLDMMKNRRADVKKGLELAGQGHMFDAIMEQVFDTKIDTLAYKKGEKLEWMMFKKKGKGPVRVAKDFTWAGDKPFIGYRFFVTKDNKKYEYVVPLLCGNLAFRKAVAAAPAAKAPPPPSPPPAPAANKAPECNVVVTPANPLCGETVVVDACGSKDPDGSIKSISLQVADGKGNIVEEAAMSASSCKKEIVMPCGPSTFKVAVTDDKGDSTDCAALNMVAEKPVRRLLPLIDLGLLRQFDPATYAFIRGGLEYRFTDKWSLIGMLGLAGDISDSDEGANAFLADVLLNYRWMSGFVGFGVGAWITGDDEDDVGDFTDDQLDLILNAGTRIFGDPDGFNTSFFIEARSAFDEFSDGGLGDFGRFGLGLRFQF